MYPHSCTIQKRTAGVADANGESAYTWATDSAQSPNPTPCEFWYASGGERSVRPVSGEAARDVLWCKLPPTVTIARDTYRVTTTQAGFSGTYRIVEVPPKNGAYGEIHHYEAELAEVQA